MLVAVPAWLPQTSLDEQELVRDTQASVWDHLIATTSFNDWLSCGDRWMVDKAVEHAYRLFKQSVEAGAVSV